MRVSQARSPPWMDTGTRFSGGSRLSSGRSLFGEVGRLLSQGNLSSGVSIPSRLSLPRLICNGDAKPTRQIATTRRTGPPDCRKCFNQQHLQQLRKLGEEQTPGASACGLQILQRTTVAISTTAGRPAACSAAEKSVGGYGREPPAHAFRGHNRPRPTPTGQSEADCGRRPRSDSTQLNPNVWCSQTDRGLHVRTDSDAGNSP